MGSFFSLEENVDENMPEKQKKRCAGAGQRGSREGPGGAAGRGARGPEGVARGRLPLRRGVRVASKINKKNLIHSSQKRRRGSGRGGGRGLSEGVTDRQTEDSEGVAEGVGRVCK